MFSTKQIFASILFAIAMTSVTAAPAQGMVGVMEERDIDVQGVAGQHFGMVTNEVDLVSLDLDRP
jgi:hypothetical protein